MWQTKYAWPYLQIWDWELIFDHAVKVISSPGVRSPWLKPTLVPVFCFAKQIKTGLFDVGV